MTVIEVLISMFIIFLLVVLYAAALNTVALTKKTNYEDVAYHVANKQMEALRSTSFSSLANTSTSISDPLLSTIPSGAGTYAIADYGPMSGLKELTVTVTWNDGIAKSVVLQTLSGNGGLNP